MKIILPLLTVGALQFAVHAETRTPTLPDATHRQADILKPGRQGDEPVILASFAVDAEGNIVAIISRRESGPGWIQVYSPSKSLLREIPLEFAPTAISIAPNGDYVAGGNGRLLRCTPDEKVLAKADLLEMLGVDPAALRETAIAEWKSDRQSMAAENEDYLRALESQVKRYKDQGSSITERDKVRLGVLEERLVQFGEFSEVREPTEREIDQMMENRRRIPSVSAGEDHVVITIFKSRGYEIWRTKADFLDTPVRVVSDLRGCCGQMDVTLYGDKIIAAENTKFEVAVYDINGKSLERFGERYKNGNGGFGGCCNPMNVIRQNNGEYLTAESSIGHIKRFSADGELIANVGRARIGGGCKHVALGHDRKLDRYYVQYQDLNHICILLPNAEAAPLVAEQDALQKEAEKAMLSLQGNWKLEGEATEPSDEFYVNTEEMLTGMEIKADHSLSVRLTDTRRTEEDGGFRRWYASGVEDGRLRVEMELEDGYVDFVALITVKDDDTLELFVNQKTRVFKRQP